MMEARRPERPLVVSWLRVGNRASFDKCMTCLSMNDPVNGSRFVTIPIADFRSGSQQKDGRES